MKNPKFRIWDTLTKKIIYFDFFSLMDRSFRVDFDPPWQILMLCSDLKDMNGKDIYEGDILELINFNFDRIRVVCVYGIARRKMASGFTCDIKSFCFEAMDGFKSFPIVENYAKKHDLDIMEVVGNIYENPDIIYTNAV